MQSLLHDLESRLARRPSEVAAILGLSRGHYYDMRRGDRPVPDYVRLHAELILRLPDALLNAVIRERLAHA